MKLTLCFTLAFVVIAHAGVTVDNEAHRSWFTPRSEVASPWFPPKQFQGKRADIEPRAPHVQFYLYTKSTPNSPKQITVNDASALSSSSYNKAHPTRVIIHGWKNNYQSPVNTEVRAALFATGNYNVFCVDWSTVASTPNYNTARYSVGDVGKTVANYIDFLNEKGGMSFSSVMVIGHSLGAHVAGYAGKNVKRGKIHTIMGLDPALPLFSYSDCATRLCSTDASFVESIQTNGGLKGFLEPIGKAAFYPNGGKAQPGCGVDLTGTCAHARAVTYYAEAIRKNNFLSIKCSTYMNAVNDNCGSTYSSVRMGAPSNYGISGYYYVPVKGTPPYGMGA